MDFEETFFANQGIEAEKVEEPKAEQPVEQPQEAPVEQPTEATTEAQQEEVTEPSSLNTENTEPAKEVEPQNQPQPTTPQSSAPDDDVFEVETDEDLAKFVSDHFGKEVTPDRLKSILEDTQQSSYANDTVKELNDYVAQGGDIRDFLEFKMTDYGQMNDLEVVYRKMQRDYPTLTSEQIQRKLNKQFMLDEDRYDEDERQDGLLDLSIAAQDARKHFEKLQQQYSSPLQTSAPKQEPQAEPEFSQEQLESFQNQMNQSVQNLKTIEMGGMTYEVNDALKSKIAESPADIGDLFVEGDNFNFDKYNQFRAIALDPDAFVKTAIEHGKTIALQELKNNRNNTTLEPETHKPSQTMDSKKANEALIKDFMGGGKRYGF